MVTKKIDNFPLSKNIRWHGVDFIDVKFKQFVLPKDLKGKTVVITSQNAVKAFAKYYPKENLKESHVYCVGEKTNSALEKNGFRVKGVALYSKDLGEKLVKLSNTRAIVLFGGNLHRPELGEIANKNGIDFKVVEVYETVFCSQKLRDKYDGIVFLSPSAIQSYLQENVSAESVAFCIGTSTGKVASAFFKKVILSNELTIESVLDKVKEYYGN